MISKSKLAIILSKLKVFDTPNVKLEQYTTDSEIAATVLWDLYMKGFIQDKTLADFGCGTGILGIGALLLGAKKVFFIDIDKKSIDILKDNLRDIDGVYEIINDDISKFDKKVDLVIQNPPFGTKVKHADKIFLEKAIGCSDIISSFHKTSTKGFVESFCRDNGCKICSIMDFQFPLKNTMKHHRKVIERVEISCYLIQHCTTQ
ncbi:MAG: METTL5 family protein [Candidatus Woesearchaeota archaeon]